MNARGGQLHGVILLAVLPLLAQPGPARFDQYKSSCGFSHGDDATGTGNPQPVLNGDTRPGDKPLYLFDRGPWHFEPTAHDVRRKSLAHGRLPEKK